MTFSVSKTEQIDLGYGYTLHIYCPVVGDPYRQTWGGMITRESEEYLILPIRSGFLTRAALIEAARFQVEAWAQTMGWASTTNTRE